MTMVGEGRKSGRTSPVAVTAHHRRAMAAKTATAMPTKARDDSRAVRVKSRGREVACSLRPASARGGIDEAAVDQLAEVDILLDELGLLGRGLHLRHDLREEVPRKVLLVL